jgi:hypothetical protein
MKFCLRELRITENKFININDYGEFLLPRLQNELTSDEQATLFLCPYAMTSTEQHNHISRTLLILIVVTGAVGRQCRF